MLRRIMLQQRICQHCCPKNHCQEAYEQLGNSKIPSIAYKIVIAFLLPALVFIFTLAVSEKAFARLLNTETLRATTGFITAVAAALAVAIGLNTFYKIHNNTKKNSQA